MANRTVESLTLNVVVAVTSFLFMAVLFRLAWRVSGDKVWRFNSFSDVTKADWCSRVNSTLHAAVVSVLVVVCVATMKFDPDTLVPTSSTTLLDITFSISIGYFLFDLAIILWWLLPMWSVFLVHHLVAVIPYVITQFFYVCHSGEYVLLLFLLVELSTMPLNAMAFLEDLGLRRTKSHLTAHCVMYATWFGCRVLLPIYLLIVIWTKIVQQFSMEEPCLLPSMICAHIIALFCIGVFCVVLTPEFYTRLRDGDKDEPGVGDRSVYVGTGVAGTMELGGGAAGGAYHDLESESGIPAGPILPPQHDGRCGDGDDGGYGEQCRGKDEKNVVNGYNKGNLHSIKVEGAKVVQGSREGLLQGSSGDQDLEDGKELVI